MVGSKGADTVELRFSEALVGDEEKEDMRDPGELCLAQLHALFEVIITVVLVDYVIINHSDCTTSGWTFCLKVHQGFETLSSYSLS